MVNQERETQKREIVNVRIKREEEFPTDPEKRFEAVFSAIGNSEAKCLTLLCLSATPISGRDLHKKFIEESRGVWKTSSSLQAEYCIHSLVPIGLVAEADFIRYGTIEYITGFRLTEAGAKYGQPIAAFLLEQSSRFPYSLLKVFGKTSTGPGKRRPVINAVKILEVLNSANDVDRLTDIVTRSGILGRSIQHHFQNLSKLGLIEYNFASSEEPGFAKYTLNPNVNREDVKPVASTYRKYVKLTAEVADLIFELKTVDSYSLAPLLRNKFPHRYKSLDSLMSVISIVLSGLAKQGICQPELYVGGKIHSQVRITETGRKLVSQIYYPIMEALSGNEDLLTQWKQIQWRKYTKDAIEKFRESSSNANYIPVEESLNRIILLVSQNPGIRPKEIERALGRVPDIFLKTLITAGKLRKEKRGAAVYYYPVE